MEDSGQFPYSVCRKGVGRNFILCVECQRWAHKRCCGFSGRIRNNVDFHCKRCLSQAVLLREVEIELNVKVECVSKFCYLGDTLGASGGVEEGGSYG